ncbi:MAG: hypothetical protein ACREF4_19090, partial [Gammaproteobacteria bacterium]
MEIFGPRRRIAVATKSAIGDDVDRRAHVSAGRFLGQLTVHAGVIRRDDMGAIGEGSFCSRQSGPALCDAKDPDNVSTMFDRRVVALSWSLRVSWLEIGPASRRRRAQQEGAVFARTSQETPAAGQPLP